MIKYHSFKLPHIILSLAIFVVGAFFGLYSSHADNLPFGSSLTGMFPGIESNYSSIGFVYGGNNFAGMFFWTSGTNLSTPEVITMSGTANSISCIKRINGIYYNNQRGRKIWPLDTGNLATLVAQGSGYSALQIAGGFYTNCSRAAGTYTPSTTAVYGQITHTRSGTIFKLTAGVNYSTGSNSISGTDFGSTLQGISNIASGLVFDSYGGIGAVGGVSSGTMLLTFGVGTGICQAFEMTPPSSIVAGNSANFTCYGNLTGGNSIAGYIMNIYSGNISGPSIYNSTIITGSSVNSRYVGNTLSVGSYSAACQILGSGVGAGGNCNGTHIDFTVTSGIVIPPSTGGTCGFQGNIAIVTVPNITVRRSIGDTYYTKATGGLDIQIRSTIPSYYVISGTEMTNIVAGNYNYTYNNINPIVNTGKIYLSTGDGIKQIDSRFTANSCTYQAPAKYVTLDLLPPSAPTNLSPANGSGICYVGNSLFSRAGAVDSGVGITQYNYKIYSNAAMTTIILNGTTGNTSISLNASSLGTGYFSGTYYRSVQAIDALGQTGNAITGVFNVGLSYCTNSGNIMIHGTIPRLRNADLNKEYLSDPFTVDGLPGLIIAYLSTGILYVNGTGSTSSGYVNNGDELNIKLKSSTQYDTTINSVFYIGPRYATYHITTRSLTGYLPTSGCILETGQRLIIQNIFDMMKETYNADQGTLSDFLFTIQSMLQDDVGLTNNCSLDYLLSITDSYIMDNIGNNTIDENTHKAPNCKEYAIKFVSSKSGYTSTTFKHKGTYFASREALIRYIDSKNPGDCNINAYQDLPTFDNTTSQSGYYIAPNGKMYQIKEKQGSGTTLYYSPDFIKAKNFTNEDDLYRFIDVNNPTIEVWNHEVDVDFDPEFHTAPNGKEYKIYGTDQGFMSYKLMKVQYFDTLEEIRAYIDKNNRY